MRKRRIALLLIPALIISGLVVFFVRYAENRQAWAMSVYNRGIYSSGKLITGNIYDRNGIMLS